MPTIRQLCLRLSVGLALTSLSACMGVATRPAATPAPPTTVAPLPANEAASDSAIRFLETRVRQDPDDFVA